MGLLGTDLTAKTARTKQIWLQEGGKQLPVDNRQKCYVTD